MKLSPSVQRQCTQAYIRYSIKGNSFAALYPQRQSFDAFVVEKSNWTGPRVTSENLNEVDGALEKMKTRFKQCSGVAASE